MSWKMMSAPINVNKNSYVQSNAPELKGKLQEFATPKPTGGTHSKAKVIHKEKLATLQQSKMSNTGITSTSRGVTVPTAHVSPHFSVVTRTLNKAVSPSHEGELRRTNSADLLSDGYSKDMYLTAQSPTKRWSSYQNIPQAPGDFNGLTGEPDITLDQTRFFREAEDILEYKTPKVKVNTDQLQAEIHRQAALANQHSPYEENHFYPEHTVQGGVRASSADSVTSSRTSSHGTNNMHYGYVAVSKDMHTKDNFKTPMPMGPHFVERHTNIGYANPYISSSHTTSVHSTNTSVHGNEHSLYSNQGSHAAEVMSNDITSWQQKHQEQLRRQHMQTAQPLPMYSNDSVPVPSMLDPHRLDAVRRAADSIIKEKDMIIDKQRLRVMSLERQTKDLESNMAKAYTKKAQDHREATLFKLQELEYENAALKAKWQEAVSNKNIDLESLEKKLGGTEYEHKQLKISMEKERNAKEMQLRLLTEKMKGRDSVISEWKQKYEDSEASREAVVKRVESMERYLSDLPTADDNNKKSSELRSLKDDKAKYKSRALELERRLSEANKNMRSKEDSIQKLEKAEKDLKQKLEKIEEEKIHLKQQLGLVESGEDRAASEEDIEELKYQNQRLKSDCEKARKLLESKHKKMQQQERQQKSVMAEMEERLSQEEAAVTALKEDLLNKDQHLRKLRASIKELGGQNQDLMEKNLSLGDRIKEFERQHTKEAHRLEQRLMKELSICFAELQSLVNICVQRAEGQDPNISVLLGVKAASLADPEEDKVGETNVPSLKYKLSKVRDLRRDIDKIRELISNKYAEDMGENLNCTTQ